MKAVVKFMNLNNKKISMGKKKKLSSGSFFFFCSGIIAGFFLSIVLVISIVCLNPEGINVYFNKEKIFNLISNEMSRRAQEEFPVFIKEVRSEVPSLVDKYLQKDFIKIGDLEIGGYLIELPDQLLAELEKDLRNDVIYYVYKLLDELGEEKFVNELSQSITGDVLESLFFDLNGQNVSIPLTKYYSIPITIWLE
jgi:hypothetical protein